MATYPTGLANRSFSCRLSGFDSFLAAAGFYIFEPEVIDMIPDGFSMLEKDVFPKLAKLGRLRGFPFAGQWFDIGNIGRYKIAQKKWEGIIPFEEDEMDLG